MKSFLFLNISLFLLISCTNVLSGGSTEVENPEVIAEVPLMHFRDSLGQPQSELPVQIVHKTLWRKKLLAGEDLVIETFTTDSNGNIFTENDYSSDSVEYNLLYQLGPISQWLTFNDKDSSLSTEKRKFNYSMKVLNQLNADEIIYVEGTTLSSKIDSNNTIHFDAIPVDQSIQLVTVTDTGLLDLQVEGIPENDSIRYLEDFENLNIQFNIFSDSNYKNWNVRRLGDFSTSKQIEQLDLPTFFDNTSAHSGSSLRIPYSITDTGSFDLILEFGKKHSILLMDSIKFMARSNVDFTVYFGTEASKPDENKVTFFAPSSTTWKEYTITRKWLQNEISNTTNSKLTAITKITHLAFRLDKPGGKYFQLDDLMYFLN